METTDTMHSAGANTVERELLAAEERYWQAMKDNDSEAMMSLTDFPAVITGPQGVGYVDEETLASMAQRSTYKVQDINLSTAKVRLLSDDVAVVAYTAHEEIELDGKQLTLDIVNSSTWIKRPDGWKCAVHTEAIAGDPFGRDRQPLQ